MLFRNTLKIFTNSFRTISKSYKLQTNAPAGQHKINNLEKRFLVWTGKFKSIDEVPPTVSMAMIEKARNKMRIRVANIMMLITLLACVAVSISGKKAHERGETVTKQNLEFHKAYNEASEKQK